MVISKTQHDDIYVFTIIHSFVSASIFTTTVQLALRDE